jgi:hypothetical protein
MRAELGVLATTGAIQAVIQGIGFISGLLVIWLLPVDQFAYYTIAAATLGSLVVLADCGIVQSVLAHGGRVWQQPASLGGVVRCALALRWRLSLVSLVIALPVLFLLLQHRGASIAIALATTASIIPMFLFSVPGQVHEAVLRLNQRLTDLQMAQLTGAGLRLVLSIAAISALPLAWIAHLGAGLGQMWQSRRARHLSKPLADDTATPDPDVRNGMTRHVQRTAPSAIYFALSGQLSIWLLAILGRTESVAEVGALGRLAMAFNLLAAIIGMVYLPRFARMRTGAGAGVLAAYWKVQCGLAALMALVVGVTALLPDLVLLFLGPRYAQLQHEVVLSVGGGALALLAGTAFNMSASRGHVPSPWAMVPFAVLVQVGLVFVLPVSTARGVLWLGLLFSLALWAFNAIHFTLLASSRSRPDPA